MPHRHRTASTPSRAKSARRAGVLKKLLITLAVVILALAIIGAIAIPLVAAGIVRSRVIEAVNTGIDGSVKIDSISLSWFGEQRVRNVSLFDPDGKAVAQADVTVRKGIFGFIGSPNDLGTVSVSGWVDIHRTTDQSPTNLERAIEPRTPAPARPSTPAATPKPIKLPPLSMNLDLRDLQLNYIVAGQRLGVSDLRITGPLALAGQTDVSLVALLTTEDKPEIGRFIRATLQSGPVIGSSGQLDLNGSGLRFNLEADLPGTWTEILVASNVQPVSTSAHILSARVSIREDAGRLVSDRQGDAVVISGPIPSTLLARIAPDQTITVESSPNFRIRATRFDIPIDAIFAGPNRADLRSSALLLSLTTTPINALISTADGSSTRLLVEPVDLRIGSEDFAQRAFAQGDLRAIINGTPSGTAFIDAQIEGILTDAGNLADIASMRPRGELRLVDAPASLIDPLLASIEALGGDGLIRDLFGDTLTATITAQGRADLGSADSALESPQFTAHIDSARTTVRAGFILDADRIESPGESLVINSTAGRALLERFAPQILAEMGDTPGPITLSIVASDIRAIQSRNALVDLDRLESSLRISIDRSAPLARGLDKVALAIDTASAAPARVQATIEGRDSTPYSANAQLILQGLSALTQVSNPLDARGVNVDGNIQLALPTSLVASLAQIDPAMLTESLGARIDGRVILTSAGESNNARIELNAPHAQASAAFLLTGSTLRSTEPLAVRMDRPHTLLTYVDADRVLSGDTEVFRISGPSTASLSAAGINLDLKAMSGIADLTGVFQRAELLIDELTLHGTTNQIHRYDDINLKLEPIDGILTVNLTGGNRNARTLTALASLPISALLDSPEPLDILSAAQPSLAVEAQIPSWLIAAFADEQQSIIEAALTDQYVRIVASPAEGATAIDAFSGQSVVRTTAQLSGDSIRLTDTLAIIHVTPPQASALLAARNPEATPPTIGLVSTAVFDVNAQPFTLPLATPTDLSGLIVSLALRDSAVVHNLIERDATPRSLGVRSVIARLEFADQGPTIEANAAAFDPASPTVPLGSLIARIEPSGNFEIQLADARPLLLDQWLDGAPTTTGAFALTFGDRLNLRANAAPAPGMPEGTDRITLTVNSPRLNTQILANRSDQRIELAQPFETAWTLAPAMFDQLIAPVIADTQGSSLKLRAAAPAAISVRTLAIDKSDNAYDLSTMRINAEFGMINANFDAVLGEPGPDQILRPVTLGKLQGSIRRDSPADDPIRFELLSMSDDLSQTIFRIDGTLSPAPSGNHTLTASASGDVPTALIDVLAGQRGLIVAAVGDSVRLQAQADAIDAERSSGRITASAQALRAELAAFGRFENGALLLGDGAASRTNITLSEISPQLSTRVLEPLFPLLKTFEKSRTEAPTIVSIVGDGLAIPTDGDLSRLNGTINLNLGSVRFQAGDLLSTVLSATSNRTAGQLGQTIQPITIRLTNGVATYEQFDIPWGDVTLRTRGTIDLVNQRMDIVVLLPLDFVSSDLRRAAQQIPLVREAAVVPMRAKGEFGKARLDLDPTALGDALPRAIEDGLNDLINRGLRDLFRR